jgi:hypothetical protein
MDPEKGNVQTVKTVYEHERGELSWKEFLLRSLIRPFVLFFEEPIIQLFGVYLAFVYGVLYSTSISALTIYVDIPDPSQWC